MSITLDTAKLDPVRDKVMADLRREVKPDHLEIEDGIAIPEPDSIEDYSGQFKLRLPRSLHRQLALQSKREGVSMNQYCVFLLSQNNAARA